MLGRKGDDNPASLRTAKQGHNALTAAGNALGEMVPPFMTFMGKKELTRLAADAPGTAFALSANGWPDNASWYKWCKHFVAFLKSKKLTKALLYCDGADVHKFLPALMLLRENNVRLYCLAPATSHKTQPFDVAFFGALEVVMARLVSKRGGVIRNQDYLPLLVVAYKEFEVKAFEKGEHALAAGFRKCGLVPFKLNPFPDTDFIKSDTLLGVNKDHAAVVKARTFKASELKRTVSSSLAASKPETKKRLADYVADTGFDLDMCGITDDAVVEQLIDDENEKKQAAVVKAARMAKRVARRLELDAEDAALAERKTAKALKRAAAAAAAALAPPPRARKPVVGGKRRRSAAEAAQADAELYERPRGKLQRS